MKMVPHVVRQGDHVPKLAHRLGVDPDAIWGDPANADLRKLRTDMHLLCPGDILYLPEPPKPTWFSVRVGETNTFVASVPVVSIAVTFTMNGKPIANESCVVHELCAPDNTRKTDGSGKLSFDAAVNLEFVNVSFPRLGIFQRLRVGHLDPPETRSGILQRLQNLGFVPVSGESGMDMLHTALLEFQYAHDLPITGEIDETTRQKLSDIHGC